MLMTVRNLTAKAINTPIVGGNGLSADATGGTKYLPLPFPFSHVTLAATTLPGAPGADQAVLPVHMEDMRKSIPWLPLEPSREWAMLVQAGVVSVTFSTETGNVNVEDAAAAAAP